jgi:hypothetical protein
VKRLTLHIIESGYEEKSKELGELVFGEGVKKAMTHEFLRGKYLLKMVEKKMKRVVGGLRGLLEELKDRYGNQYVEYLQKMEITVKALSSWPPDLKIYGFTPAILDAIFGEGNWKNAFPRPPVVRGNGDLYDASNYTREDFREAKANLEKFFQESRNPGGFNFLDDNKLLFTDMDTTAEEYLIGNNWDFVANVDGVLYYA